MRKTRRRKSPRKEQQHPKIKEEKKEKETKKWPLATRLLFGNGHHSKMFFLNIYFLFFLVAAFIGGRISRLLFAFKRKCTQKKALFSGR